MYYSFNGFIKFFGAYMFPNLKHQEGKGKSLPFSPFASVEFKLNNELLWNFIIAVPTPSHFLINGFKWYINWI